MESRESGTVKAWIEAKGMGFITPLVGDTDYFVHRSMLTDGQSLQIGAPVSFVPSIDATKGKPIATQMTGACPAPGAADGFAASPTQPPPEGYQVGVVKAWIEGRGMGFITPPDGSPDLWVHQTFLTDGVALIIGSQVQYKPGWDAMKNKPIAQEVSGASQVKGSGKGGGVPGGGPGGGAPSGDNLYISGLPKNSTEETIRNIFAQYGAVTNVKLLPDNGSFERVALVRMGAPEQAEWLVWNLNGNIPLGLETIIQVKHAASGGKGGGAVVMPPGGVGGWAAPQQQWQAAKPVTPSAGDNLYISGLPMDSTTESVAALFGQYGTIISAKVLESPGKPDKVALVRMGSLDEAKWLLENLNGNIPEGIDAVISIKYASNNQGGKDAKGGKGYGAAPQDAWSKGKAVDSYSSPYGNGKGAGGKQWAPQNVAPLQPQHIPPPPPTKKDKLSIAGLPAESTEESVMGLIGQYGAISHVKMMPSNGGPRTAIVTMGEEDSAKWLVDTLNGNIPQGIETPVTITYVIAAPPQVAAVQPSWGAQQPSWGAPAPQPPALSGAQVTGTVKHWVEDRGMGFITPSEGGQDCFIHRSDLLDGLTLIPGSTVTFVMGWDNLKAKPTATQVSGATGGDGVGKGVNKPAKGAGKGW